MQLLKKTLIFLISFNISLATAADTVVLQEGEKAPFSGLLFTNQKANDTRLLIEELKYKNESLERSVVLYKKNEEISNQQVNNLLEQNAIIIENSTSGQYKTWIIVIVSVAATLGAVYAGKQITK